MRRQIAALAARMMAEEGISDFGFAKRRAARRLGGAATSLPNNAEIETQLRTWQSLYQDGEHDLRLRQMRLAAQDLMRQLADFDPWLVGAVLDGTAGRYSELDIEVYPQDSAKDVEIFLLNLGLQPEHREARRIPHPPVPEAILTFEWLDVPVRLVVYPARHLRGGKRRGERMALAALNALLAKEEQPAAHEAVSKTACAASNGATAEKNQP